MRTIRHHSARAIASALGAALIVASATLCVAIASVEPAGASAPNAISPLPPTMGMAANYAVLAGTTVTNTGASVLHGSLGLSPGSSVVGFPPGQVPAPAAIDQTNAAAAQAQSDLTNAYLSADGRSPSATEPADLTGLTLPAGVYAASGRGALSLTGALTLDGGGNANSVFVLQTDSQLTTASTSTVNLVNGAQECNVFWQVGSSATLGSGSAFVGNILALTSITVNSGASVHGRALARNGAVTLINDVFTQPTCARSFPDTNYPIPSGALFVSPSGSDANPGTQAAPLATVTRAVALAPNGSTIVLRGGVYRESVNSVFHQITIQAYPHEQPWLDGRQVVTGFAASGAAWVRTAWNPNLCRTCYDPNAILPASPAAGLPDMVFVDGVPQQQVLTLAAASAGKFYVDATNRALYLGTNPTGHVVESTVLAKAMEFNTAGATGSILRGVGVIGYGATWNSNTNSAMVIAGSPNITFENDTFAWSASRGLAIFAAGGVVRGSALVDNGFQGLAANAADGLLIDSSYFAGNNAEQFVYALSPYAGAAGAKITGSKNVIVRDSVFEDNSSSALWLDISNQGVTVVRNLLQRNLWNGITIELSDTALIASNVSVDNSGYGIKISGTSNTRVWNNTLANNGTAQLGVYEDPRSNPNSTQFAAGITWNTANITAQNNILASDLGTPTMPLLQTGDSNSPKKVTASQMIMALDYSVYARASATAPTDLSFWCNLTASAYGTHYKTLAALQSGTAREAAGIERVAYAVSPVFVSERTGDYHLLTGSPAGGSGRALPSDIAATVGVTAGVAVDRGALVWPGSATAVNPTMPTPVFGLLNPTTGDRIYTTSTTEVTALLATGYVSQGVVFHAATAPLAGLVAVYRLAGLSSNHLYTPSTTERDKLVAAGWTLEGTAFFAPTTAMAGLIQVYRYFDQVTFDHYLSTSPVVPVGSRFDANAFWAAP